MAFFGDDVAGTPEIQQPKPKGTTIKRDDARALLDLLSKSKSVVEPEPVAEPKEERLWDMDEEAMFDKLIDDGAKAQQEEEEQEVMSAESMLAEDMRLFNAIQDVMPADVQGMMEERLGLIGPENPVNVYDILGDMVFDGMDPKLLFNWKNGKIINKEVIIELNRNLKERNSENERMLEQLNKKGNMTAP